VFFGMRDGLTQFPQFIKAFWSPAAVDPRIAFDEQRTFLLRLSQDSFLA